LRILSGLFTASHVATERTVRAAFEVGVTCDETLRVLPTDAPIISTQSSLEAPILASPEKLPELTSTRSTKIFGFEGALSFDIKTVVQL
jgi:hypothetical protein